MVQSNDKNHSIRKNTHSKGNNWTCPNQKCRASCFPNKSECYKCGTSRPQQRPKGRDRDGERPQQRPRSRDRDGERPQRRERIRERDGERPQRRERVRERDGERPQRRERIRERVVERPKSSVSEFDTSRIVISDSIIDKAIMEIFDGDEVISELLDYFEFKTTERELYLTIAFTTVMNSVGKDGRELDQIRRNFSKHYGQFMGEKDIGDLFDSIPVFDNDRSDYCGLLLYKKIIMNELIKNYQYFHSFEQTNVNFIQLYIVHDMMNTLINS